MNTNKSMPSLSIATEKHFHKAVLVGSLSFSKISSTLFCKTSEKKLICLSIIYVLNSKCKVEINHFYIILNYHHKNVDVLFMDHTACLSTPCSGMYVYLIITKTYTLTLRSIIYELQKKLKCDFLGVQS